MMKVLPKDLMDSLKDARTTTTRVQDSLNGELFSRSETEDLPNLPSKIMLTPWLDMPQSVKKTGLFQLLNQKFLQMELTQSKNALSNLKESSAKS